ncbi:ankyrin repeat domain-containing protein 35 [Neodiprion virginianus]|uniref:ankyrin repeat domain-containing protein 35 n=1 Tax=Neodiprion virginianus TaxID=2961670 RepID=UPI001EE6C3F7|nr:ankyrin repeat domain-containing protein 35 [Neodiprion virginianus]
MDTKTPPITQKQNSTSQQHLDRTKFKTPPVRHVQISLPPLTPPPNRRQRLKTPNSPWARGSAGPGIYAADGGNNNYHTNRQSERPYRVLHLGATPLMHACQQADRSRVLHLLKEQRDTIGYRDRTLRNALHYCMDAGTGGAVASAAPELVNAPDAEGHTPLHLAVIAGDAQLVAVLLANGADVNAKDSEGHSVLHWATVCGEVECVRLVLAAGARPSTPDMRGGSPLHYAAQCCGAAAPSELSVPKKIGLKVLQSLLDYGANHNAKDEDGRQPILWAASAGSVDALLALARAGGSAAAGASDKDGLTALHCAASRGHAGCVEALVNLCGSQPDHVDDNGCSALHYAATLGHADATALLLRLGADPNRQDRKGRTPALCAAAKGQLETLKLLAQHGGSLYARTVRGSGVAHESAASGRVELIKWLAKKRPGILDVATHDGRTPLHIAALHGHVDACKVLLDNGARVNAILRTSKGGQMTALDAALYRGHRDCAKLIQMHGGTTAQHVKTRKIGGTIHCKELAAQLRARKRDGETSSDDEEVDDRDVSPRIRRRRRRRGSREPDCDVSEQREEDRGGSRSYSDQEEPRSTSRRAVRSRRRRARSESCGRGRGSRKRNAKQKSGGRNHEYDGSSSTHSGEATEFGSDEDTESDGSVVSEDSLEVVIVKKSVEKTSERVEVSGRKPKRTSGGEKSSVIRSTRSKTRRKTVRKKPKEQNDAEGNGRPENLKKSEPEAPKPVKTPTNNDAEERRCGRKMQYQIEAGDSTSQEAIERVTVTVMVHKDHLSDTPKTTSIESSSRNGDTEKSSKDHQSAAVKEKEEVDRAESDNVKQEDEKEEVEEEEQAEKKEIQEQRSESEPKKKTRPRSARPGSSRGKRVTSARTRMDHILEKADEMQSALVQKAADLKKGIEEMREQITGEKTGDDRGAQESSSSEEKVAGKNGQEESDGVVTQKVTGTLEGTESDLAGSEKNVAEESKTADSNGSKIEHGSSGDASEHEKISVGLEAKKSISFEESSNEKESEDLVTDQKRSADDQPTRSGKSSSRSSIRSKSRPGTAVDKSAGSPDSKSDSKSVSKPGSRMSKSRSGDSRKSDSVKSVDDVESSNAAVKERQETVTERLGEIKAKSSDPDDNESSKTGKELVEHDGKFVEEVNDVESESRVIVEESSSSPQANAESQKSRSRPSTAKQRGKSSGKGGILRRVDSSDESSPARTAAIVAVIESPEWPEDEEDEEEEEEEEEEAIDNEIREAIGEYPEPETDLDDNSVGVMRVLPSTSDEETPRTLGQSRTSGIDSLPQVAPRPRARMLRVRSPGKKEDRARHRRDSGGRDSGIEPSPRISKIPRRTSRCYPNTEKQQALNMETVTRDVQISLRRYHLERKIFFQLMELKRLQIRNGRANEQVLVKRQVEAFHRAGTSGPTLGVAKYDQPLTFRHFEAFLYEQLRRLQRRPATPDWCTGAKQCTQKTHRCHHATSAYTSLPVYTYLGVGDRSGNLLPSIEGRGGRGQMTVEVTHGENKQVIALPAERLDRGKRYFVTFTVRGDAQDREKSINKNSQQLSAAAAASQRNAKSV